MDGCISTFKKIGEQSDSAVLPLRSSKVPQFSKHIQLYTVCPVSDCFLKEVIWLPNYPYRLHQWLYNQFLSAGDMDGGGGGLLFILDLQSMWLVSEVDQ